MEVVRTLNMYYVYIMPKYTMYLYGGVGGYPLHNTYIKPTTSINGGFIIRYT